MILLFLGKYLAPYLLFKSADIATIESNLSGSSKGLTSSSTEAKSRSAKSEPTEEPPKVSANSSAA